MHRAGVGSLVLEPISRSPHLEWSESVAAATVGNEEDAKQKSGILVYCHAGRKGASGNSTVTEVVDIAD